MDEKSLHITEIVLRQYASFGKNNLKKLNQLYIAITFSQTSLSLGQHFHIHIVIPMV